jgi:hypothetical protein
MKMVFTYTAHFNDPKMAEKVFEAKYQMPQGMSQLDGCEIHMALPNHLASPIAHDIKQYGGILSPYKSTPESGPRSDLMTVIESQYNVPHNLLKIALDIMTNEQIIIFHDKLEAAKLID